MSRFTLCRCAAWALLLVLVVATGTSQATPPISAQTEGGQINAVRLPSDPATPERLLERGATPGLVLRQRQLIADLDALGAGPGARLRLDLFEDVILTATADRVAREGDGMTWTGSVEGFERSTVTLATSDGIMAGHVATPHALYEIRARLDVAGQPIPQRYVVRELHPRSFAPEAEPLVPTEADAGPPISSADRFAPTSVSASATKVRILVLYTKAAAKAAGGNAAMKAEIKTLIAALNTALTASKARFKAELALAKKIAGTEEALASGDPENDLVALRTIGDKKYDKAHKFRNKKEADNVMLIVSAFFQAPTSCGIGYRMTNPSSAFRPFAFSVSFRACISNRTPAHEFGHNAGGCHDQGNAPTCTGTFSHSKGFIASDDSQRTVMGIGSSCSSCPRMTRFSNKKTRFDSGGKAGSAKADFGRALKQAKDVILNMFESGA